MVLDLVIRRVFWEVNREECVRVNASRVVRGL